MLLTDSPGLWRLEGGWGASRGDVKSCLLADCVFMAADDRPAVGVGLLELRGGGKNVSSSGAERPATGGAVCGGSLRAVSDGWRSGPGGLTAVVVAGGSTRGAGLRGMA